MLWIGCKGCLFLLDRCHLPVFCRDLSFSVNDHRRRSMRSLVVIPEYITRSEQARATEAKARDGPGGLLAGVEAGSQTGLGGFLWGLVNAMHSVENR